MDAAFTLDDFMAQMRQVKNLGPAGKLMGMIPRMNDLTKKMGMNGVDVERQMTRMRAIYDSMSRKEREDTGLLDGQRRRRVARGAGVGSNEVSQFVKQFEMSRAMMHRIAYRGGPDRRGLVLPLVTGDATRRDPSWVHPEPLLPRPSRSLASLIALATLAAVVCTYFLYQIAR